MRGPGIKSEIKWDKKIAFTAGLYFYAESLYGRARKLLNRPLDASGPFKDSGHPNEDMLK